MKITSILFFLTFVLNSYGQQLAEKDFSYLSSLDSIGFEKIKLGRELNSIEREKYLISIKDYPSVQKVCGANFISQEWINDSIQFILIMCDYDNVSWCDIVTVNSNYDIIESKQLMSQSFGYYACSDYERGMIYENLFHLPNNWNHGEEEYHVISEGHNAIRVNDNKFRIENNKKFYMWSETDDSQDYERTTKKTSSLLVIQDDGKMSFIDTLLNPLKDGIYKTDVDQYLSLIAVEDNHICVRLTVGTEDCNGVVGGVLKFKSDNQLEFFANDCKLQFHVKDDKIIVEEKEPWDCDYHGHNCFFDGVYSVVEPD